MNVHDHATRLAASDARNGVGTIPGYDQGLREAILAAQNAGAVEAEAILRGLLAQAVPEFECLSPGEWRSKDLRFHLYRLGPSHFPGWNVEYEVDYVNQWIDLDIEARYGDPRTITLIVDGAASKRDAVALFRDWFVDPLTKGV